MIKYKSIFLPYIFMQNLDQFEQRKQDHIALALMPANQTADSNPFDAVKLVHEALPDCNFKDIQIDSLRFGLKVPTPFLVSSMTAGHQKADLINRHLMQACAEKGWAMGVGSQRRELSYPEASKAWKPLRVSFPEVQLFSNIGIAQLLTASLSDIQRLTSALEAQALIIHCNPLQECIQPEGTTNFQGCWKALETLVKNLDLPIIVKETGCGFSSKTLQRLQDCGVAAVDVSGLGGTHWGRIEGCRAEAGTDRFEAAVAFKDWGIDTVQSIKNALAIRPLSTTEESPFSPLGERVGERGLTFEIWGSGGVRHGLDAAKLCALGATTVGFAKPLLDSALQSAEAVLACMQNIEYGLKVAMFCTGSLTLSDLKSALCP